jgi:hypothetical protein
MSLERTGLTGLGRKAFVRQKARGTGSAAPWAILAASFLPVALSGCAGSGPLAVELRHDVLRPDPAVVLFLCDGVQPELLERGCREGWLPNIQRRFVLGGTRVEHAIAVSPAITYCATTSILTGALPGLHRIPGNRWYDPQRRLFRDYGTIRYYRAVNEDSPAPTLYERIAPRFSTSIQAAFMRGVSDNIANWAQSGVRWFFGAYTAVDALTAKTVELVASRANARRQWPDLLTCYFPGLDSVGHEHGPESAEYRAALVNLDHHVGRVCDWLESQGLLETTFLVLVSDHGMLQNDTNGYVDLFHLIRDGWGLRATDRVDQDEPLERRRRYFDRYDTVVEYQDGRCALLYFAGPGGWDERPSPELVIRRLASVPKGRELWNLSGVDVVAYLAGDDEAVLRSSRGTASVRRRGGEAGWQFCYVPDPDDVLGYLSDPELAAFVADGFHDSRAWLRATCRQEFPDIVPQIISLLHEPRAGQVIVYAAPGYTFVSQAGGHGGLRRAEMRVPLYFAGPGIKPGGSITCARQVDVVPTVLDLLGADVPQDEWLCGVTLLPELGVRTVQASTRL